MIACKKVKNPLALARDSQNCPPPVVHVRCPHQQAFALGTIDQFDRAIVLQAKPLSSVGDRHGLILRGPCHLQQKLMLLRLETRFQRRALAEVQEPPQFESKLS